MLQSNPDFNILSDQIWARNEFSTSTLIVPFKIEFTNVPGYKGMSKAEVLLFKGELRTRGSNLFCGQSIIFENHELSSQRKSLQSQFQFYPSPETIDKIEKKRIGDLLFSIAVTALTAEHTEMNLTSHKSQTLISGFDKASGHIDFQIEQSYWVNKVLPNLGYQPLRLFELPAANMIIPAEYATSLKELDEAKKYFLNGDYDKAVGHCRAALDPLKPEKEKIRKYVTSKSEFNWAAGIMDATDEWLNKIVRSTVGLTSKTHHSPSTGHFDRGSAEIVMMMTTAIIAFIGKVSG